MKSIFLFLFVVFSSITLIGQKYALIDRSFKKPILFTDSVTIGQVSSNYFPVNVNDIDTLLANIEYLKDQLKSIQRAKFKSYKLGSGNTFVNVTTVPHAYGDSYDILFLTSVHNINAEYLVATNKDLNKRAIKKLNAFGSYVKSDKSLVIKEFRQYQPVILDATIFISTKRN
jgi:hypothetical protein